MNKIEKKKKQAPPPLQYKQQMTHSIQNSNTRHARSRKPHQDLNSAKAYQYVH